jgi:predicted anti-sigma-YlaC factor YlaD
MANRRDIVCDRTRAWVSAELDCKLSGFESSLLQAHLSKCEACSSFRADVTAFTDALRAAPLEESEFRVVVHGRRRILPMQTFRVTAAALAVAAVGLGTMFASLDARGIFSGASTPPASASDASELFRQFRASKPQLYRGQDAAVGQRTRSAARRSPGLQPS